LTAPRRRHAVRWRAARRSTDRPAARRSSACGSGLRAGKRGFRAHGRGGSVSVRPPAEPGRLPPAPWLRVPRRSGVEELAAVAREIVRPGGTQSGVGPVHTAPRSGVPRTASYGNAGATPRGRPLPGSGSRPAAGSPPATPARPRRAMRPGSARLTMPPRPRPMFSPSAHAPGNSRTPGRRSAAEPDRAMRCPTRPAGSSRAGRRHASGARLQQHRSLGRSRWRKKVRHRAVAAGCGPSPGCPVTPCPDAIRRLSPDRTVAVRCRTRRG
jgi:hypothetical protein